MKPYRFHPQAETDVDEAIGWYLGRNQETAFSFALELQFSYRRIVEGPLLFPAYLLATRRCVLQDFPYSVVFRELPEVIEIVAVAHAKRRPGYWINRL